MKLWYLTVWTVVMGCLWGSSCEASKKYNRYLAHIFNKYGSGGTLSFEGLEHLMHSLGLGGLEFNPTHTIEEHRPDGFKIPDLTLEDDFSEDNDHPHRVKNSGEQFEVKQLIVDNKSEDNTQQALSDLSDMNNDSLISVETNKTDFKEMHDPKHRHPRHHADPVPGNKCLSPKSVIKLVVDPDDVKQSGKLNYNIELTNRRSKRHTQDSANAKDEDRSTEYLNKDEEYATYLSSMRITPIAFMKMCPALLVQIDQDACAKPIELLGKTDPEGYLYAWIYATIAIFVISCCGLIGIAIVPLAKSIAYNEILKFLVAVAVGTLCGDALMHLLPHALISEHGEEVVEDFSDEHNNEPVLLCGCAFLTALFMYSLETLLPLIRGSGGHHHGHSHQDANHSTNIDMEVVPKPDTTSPKELNVMLHETEVDQKKGIGLSPVAFMVVLGDGLHNITDGLAIGAAFAGDPVTGMATALAVLCHELPHELGDFALLLQTGVNIKRAAFLNVVSSILSFMGMAAGLLLAGIHSNVVKWIYASTAGSFLYIALADLLPEMNRTGQGSLKNSLIQISGMFLGGLIMLAIALNEDSLRGLFE